LEFRGDAGKMSGAIVLIILIAGIILAAYLTRLVNYYTFGYRMKEKDEGKDSCNR